jgi:Protein of unknown function with HXXEE motif
MGSREWVLWLLVTASAVHVVEEHALGWQGWADVTLGRRFGVHPTWSDFWATNTALLAFAFSAAVVGWQATWFALSLPALCLVNAALFHVVPSIVQRRPNPGVFTAVVLYVPLGIWCYVAAGHDGELDAGALIWSILVGAALMAAAIGFLRLKPRFAYPDTAAASVGAGDERH